jgi:membrane associated rhomboid family serine protease
MTITLGIVIFTCLLSISAISNSKLMDDLIFYAPAIAQRKQYYRFLSHGFIHADYIHLAFNMIALYSFGQALEEQLFSHECVFGKKGVLFYVLLYVGGLIVASIPDYLRHRNNYNFRSLGASGAVSGVIFAAIALLPQLPIRFFFIPIDIPGYVFGLLYLVVSAYLDKKGGGNINHSAHFWGAAYGLIFTFVCGQIFGNMNMIENFLRQIKSFGRLLPFQCN